MKTGVIDEFTYSMISPDQRESMECQLVWTKNNASLNTDKNDDKEEHLQYTELQTDQQKKRRKKKCQRRFKTKVYLLHNTPDSSFGS